MNIHETNVDSLTVVLPEWTYFIRGADAIKIGRSRQPRARMAELQPGSGTKLELLLAVPFSRLTEPDAHRKFKHLRLHGEWFRPEQELLDFIGQLRSETKKPRPRVRSSVVVQRERPATHVENMVSKLIAARPRAPQHKRNHISNLVEQLRNHASATDPRIRSFLKGAIARSMTSIERA